MSHDAGSIRSQLVRFLDERNHQVKRNHELRLQAVEDARDQLAVAERALTRSISDLDLVTRSNPKLLYGGREEITVLAQRVQDDILSIEGVRDFHSGIGNLTVETLPVKITHDGTEYDIGSFYFQLFPESGSLQIRKPARYEVWLDSPRRCYYHPHISEDFGRDTDLRSHRLIYNALLSGNVLELVRLLIQLARSYDEGTALIPITHWPLVVPSEVT